MTGQLGCKAHQPGSTLIGLENLRRQLADRLDTEPSGHTARRRRLYELDPVYHCSVIGTCFGLGELRRLLAKLGTVAPGASDHELHHDAVLVAGRHDQSGKLISKALDRKFKAALNRFAAATDAEALGRLWQEAVARGDIPEGYWAVLTHPAATPALVRRVFGEVHMLSHLVGAANRADIRRLQLIERQNETLAAKLDQQQRHLTDTLGAKERRIRELEAMLASRDDLATPDGASAALADALRRERERRGQLERRVETLEARLAVATERPAVAVSSRPAVTAAMDEEVVPLPSEGERRLRLPELGGATLLIVGGRAAQMPALSRAVARAGGALLHHDGGVEMSLGLLPGLVSRADRVVLALDCVSHAAAGAGRRFAQEGGKPLLPLPGLSLASLARALAA